MNIVIISNGPGLPEVVNENGHSSSWIPTLIKDSKANISNDVGQTVLTKKNFFTKVTY